MLQPQTQHITAANQDIENAEGPNSVPRYSLKNFMITSRAIDKTIHSLAAASNVYKQVDAYSKVNFTKAVIKSLSAAFKVRYEEGLCPSVAPPAGTKRGVQQQDRQPTIYPGSEALNMLPVPELSGDGTDLSVTAEKAVDDSSMSPTACTWADQLCGPCFQLADRSVSLAEGTTGTCIV